MSRSDPMRRALAAHDEGDLVKFAERRLTIYKGSHEVRLPPELVENLDLDEDRGFDIWLEKSGNRVILDFDGQQRDLEA